MTRSAVADAKPWPAWLCPSGHLASQLLPLDDVPEEKEPDDGQEEKEKHDDDDDETEKHDDDEEDEEHTHKKAAVAAKLAQDEEEARAQAAVAAKRKQAATLEAGKSRRSPLTCAGGCRELSRSFFGWAQLARERAPARAAAGARALEPQLRSGSQRPRPRAKSGEPPRQSRSRPRRCRGTRGTPLKVHPQLRVAEGNDAHRARGSFRRERVGSQPLSKKEKIDEKESPHPLITPP